MPPTNWKLSGTGRERSASLPYSVLSWRQELCLLHHLEITWAFAGSPHTCVEMNTWKLKKAKVLRWENVVFTAQGHVSAWGAGGQGPFPLHPLCPHLLPLQALTAVYGLGARHARSGGGWQVFGGLCFQPPFGLDGTRDTADCCMQITQCFSL